MACNSPLCGICDFRQKCVPSTAWCFECNEGLCEECNGHHVLNKASKSHGIIPLNEYQKLPVSVLQIADSCKSHSEKYQAYCHEHECSCCTKCIIEEHKNCKDRTDIHDFISSIKSSNMILEIENSLREVTENLKKIHKNRTGNLLSLTLYKEDIEKEIRKSRYEMNEHFDRLERELLKELQTIENAERRKINKILESVERKQKEIDGLQISLAMIKQHASDLQTFLVSKQIETELVDTDRIIQSIQDNRELSDVIISYQTNDKMKSLGNISKFGEIVVQTSQRNMSLVRQKIKEAQTRVADKTKGSHGSFDHQYDIIKTEKDPCFIVTVKPSADAFNFGLDGRYRLRLTSSCFILEDIEKMTSKCCWPYDIVRKYGKRGIEKEFAITVGRRNVLGEGTVEFKCSSLFHPGKIMRLFQIIIKKMQSDLKL